MRNAKPTVIENDKGKEVAKGYRLSDGGNLYLQVDPSGGKRWIVKYRWHGKEKTYSGGTYPTVGLADARAKRDEVERLKSQGIDPSLHKQTNKSNAKVSSERTFQVVAINWLEEEYRPSITENQYFLTRARFENYIFPVIGKIPFLDLTYKQILDALLKVEKLGKYETANRIKTGCSQIYTYEMGRGNIDQNPVANMRGVLKRRKTKNHPAITDPKKLSALLRAIEGYSGFPVVCAALRLQPYIFVRPVDLRFAKWSEIKLDESLWEFVDQKMERGMMVPLPRQAVKILRDLHPLTGYGDLVFPSVRSRSKGPISDTSLKGALDSLGYKDVMSAHGFRATGRTILDETLDFRTDYIEHHLGHVVRDPNGTAYNRAKYLNQRREMLQTWADYLDNLRDNH
ncbi:integrase arm-type DNA-binding domain-containing protein [Halomonas sp. TRM85114]|nr:integrase arm-type DNA-binding domain-containing protein [Halomonas jincaotanensis]